MSKVDAPAAERPSLRERNKQKRREAILDAALLLLRAHDLSTITAERIAELAEVSPATVYNLVGTRDQLLLSLIDRVVDELRVSLAEGIAAADLDPIATALLIVDQSTAAFVADSAAYRQVVAFARNVVASDPVPHFDPSTLQVEAMMEAQRQGIIGREFDPIALGRQIYLNYTGALFRWSAGWLSDDGFTAAVRHGLYVVLAAAATEAHRGRFLDALGALSTALNDDAWSRGHRDRANIS